MVKNALFRKFGNDSDRADVMHARMMNLEEMVGGLVDRLSDQPQHRLPDTPPALTAPSALRESSITNQDPLTQGLITFTEAEILCQTYRQMSEKHFPCVILPQRLGVVELQQERPMLLQAILVVASWQKRTLQIALEKFYLKDLGTRFFNGERNLDILQGLLVYLAWYHFNVTESSQYQAYRLASLCVTMIFDLGLNRKPLRGTTQHDLILNSKPESEHVAHQTPGFWSHEARRALVGAYILSTLCSLMCRKQSPLAFSTYLEQCATSIREDAEVSSDKALVYFVQILRIVNEVYNIFDYGDPDHSLSMSDDKVQMVVRALDGQLTSWRASLLPELSQHAQLNTWGDLVGAYAHEIGLHGNLRNPPFSATRVAIMFDCLAYVEKYMKRTVALPFVEMQTWTAFDWRQLTYMIMLASKISLTIDVVACDNESTARIAQLDSYLGQLYTRTQELFSMTSTPQGQTHYFQSLLNQWKSVRIWYQTVLQRRTASHCNNQPSRIISEDQFVSSDDSSNAMQSAPMPSLGSLDSWPDDNFGLLPISAADFMILDSLGYS
ncbi:hypothetical protein ASPWEDRAFT_174836 [Aspergillus wentii DTO 134E9]|uniref:Xylanolytic transcriptional activator regulatory domain-containing protein n=1 Tax=Aspergillus wentii DTO 134E9 TaxID=1073089 RepID=A0A1L9RES6_ASPWE|nr:uncharacterized protein ASPWEDRAFT_174836 [Aspergillus wentii DTO 134E9]OJJ33429.1 hypothetical protein ASPWEDRAFT_174836 [Aspergillus wentii DTO 134E9]